MFKTNGGRLAIYVELKLGCSGHIGVVFRACNKRQTFSFACWQRYLSTDCAVADLIAWDRLVADFYTRNSFGIGEFRMGEEVIV